MRHEPLIAPVSPGAALARLAQVTGALERHPAFAQALPADAIAQLQGARDALLRALEADEAISIVTALGAAQDQLCRLYQQLIAAAVEPAFYAALHFPDPAQAVLQAIDTGTIIATFSMPAAQVLTSIAFLDAPGATAYWLHELRVINGEIAQDAMLESYTPLFPRVRLPCGTHVFRIESRNPSCSVFSDEFTIEVPVL